MVKQHARHQTILIDVGRGKKPYLVPFCHQSRSPDSRVKFLGRGKPCSKRAVSTFNPPHGACDPTYVRTDRRSRTKEVPIPRSLRSFACDRASFRDNKIHVSYHKIRAGTGKRGAGAITSAPNGPRRPNLTLIFYCSGFSFFSFLFLLHFSLTTLLRSPSLPSTRRAYLLSPFVCQPKYSLY